MFTLCFGILYFLKVGMPKYIIGRQTQFWSKPFFFFFFGNFWLFFRIQPHQHLEEFSHYTYCKQIIANKQPSVWSIKDNTLLLCCLCCTLWTCFSCSLCTTEINLAQWNVTATAAVRKAKWSESCNSRMLPYCLYSFCNLVKQKELTNSQGRKSNLA